MSRSRLGVALVPEAGVMTTFVMTLLLDDDDGLGELADNDLLAMMLFLVMPHISRPPSLHHIPEANRGDGSFDLMGFPDRPPSLGSKLR